MLDSPALDFSAVAASFTGWVPLRQLIMPLAYGLARLVFPVDLETAMVTDAVRDFPGPVFIAHGSGDTLVPVTVSRNLVAARGGNVTFVETDAQHLRSWQADREGYRSEMLSFLKSL